MVGVHVPVSPVVSTTRRITTIFKKPYLLIGTLGSLILFISVGVLFSFGAVKAGGDLSAALVQHEQRSMVGTWADFPTPGKTIIHQKPKQVSQQRPTVQPTTEPVAPVTTASFPACYTEPGWFYGSHGSVFEYGTDFDCPYHTPITALWGGKVVWSDRTWWNGTTAGGLVVVVAYVPGLGMESTYYLHLDWNAVSVGQYISRGQVVGYSGGQVGYGNWPTSPQYTSGPHLEMGFCYPYEPHPVGYNTNPLPYIYQALG